MTNVAFDTEADAERGRCAVLAFQAIRPLPRISIQAFCETDAVANPLERAADDRRMAKTHLKVHMGGVQTAVDFYQTAPTPNLIMLESRAEPRELMADLGQSVRILRSGLESRRHRPLQRCRPLSRPHPRRHLGIYRRANLDGRNRRPSSRPSSSIRMRLRSAAPSPLSAPREGLDRRQSPTMSPGRCRRCSSRKSSLPTWISPFGTANINFDQDPGTGYRRSGVFAGACRRSLS